MIRSSGIRGRKAVLWLSIGTGLLVLAAANGHLVYVAMRSQPDCVVHVRAGDAVKARGQFSAAQSACSNRSGPGSPGETR
jgi:hypothetical protein